MNKASENLKKEDFKILMSHDPSHWDAEVNTKYKVNSQKIFKSVKKESLLIYARIMTVILIIPATLIASKGYSVLYLFFVADMDSGKLYFNETLEGHNADVQKYMGD